MVAAMFNTKWISNNIFVRRNYGYGAHKAVNIMVMVISEG
jgi:hypothetical protein